MSKTKQKITFLKPNQANTEPRTVHFKIPAHMHDDLTQATELIHMSVNDLMAQIFRDHIHPKLKKDLLILQADIAAAEAAKLAVQAANDDGLSFLGPLPPDYRPTSIEEAFARHNPPPPRTELTKR